MMSNRLSFRVLLVFGLTLALQGCATSPQRMVERHDHAGLATYFSQEAEALRQRSNIWRSLAVGYDQQASKTTAKPFVYGCQQIANNYDRAAQQADELAALHRREASGR
jgi:hypothetical protein